MKDFCGFYIHIPFCVRKCNYCDFLSSPMDEKSQGVYISALINEIHLNKENIEKYDGVRTVYFGGGTPSLLSEENLERLIVEVLKAAGIKFELVDGVQKYYDIRGIEGTRNKPEDEIIDEPGNKQGDELVDESRNKPKDELDNKLEIKPEITLEVNPGTADYKKLRRLFELGVNRLSIGMQSTDDMQLKRLGRIHTYAQFLECYEDAHRAGFDNVSVDIMSALPGQSLEDYEETLRKVCELSPAPRHISSYSLIIEPGTPFYSIYGGKEAEEAEGEVEEAESAIEKEEAELPDEDTEREMYVMTSRILAEYGYQRYEISNYAKEGFESRHNSSYWTRIPYFGFGLGASSFVFDTRFENTRDFKEYTSLLSEEVIETSIDTPLDSEKKCDKNEVLREPYEVLKKLHREVKQVTQKEKMEEYVYLGLRLTKGISKIKFLESTGVDFDNVYGKVTEKYRKMGMLICEGNIVRFSERGLDISNYILSDFLLD
ncbi:MAG TPA: coproporphyrinogen III oxidase [Lachnospiraceae bacterium]|nr:coproporphyrinogen III oxidase [Lachnospiraceae bacterium]